jgi:hypothetical protein
MQVRIARLFAERRGLSLTDAARLMAQAGSFDFIANNFAALHVEGDEAVLDEVVAYMNRERQSEACHA